MMEVKEHSSYGTLIGYLSAHDPDIGENALIDYIITGMSLLYRDRESIYLHNR